MEIRQMKMNKLLYIFREAGLLVISLATLFQKCSEIRQNSRQLLLRCLRLVFHQLSNCPAFGQKKEEIGEISLLT
jgi:hypothetical protein